MPAGAPRESRTQSPGPPNIAPPPRSPDRLLLAVRASPRPRLRWLWILLLAVAGLPGRGPDLRLDDGGEGRRRARPAAGRTTSRGRRTSSSAATRAPASPRRSAGARHRQRRRPAHRHDHAAAHRRRAEPADVDPPRLHRGHPRAGHAARSTPPTRSAARSCWCGRSSRTPGSGSTTTSRSASAAWSTWSTPSAASRSARPTMKDPLANLDIEKGCQEADGAHRARLRPLPAHLAALGDIDRREHQREVVVGRRHTRRSRRGSILNPVRY